MSVESFTLSTQRILRRIETAQMPSVKELPQFPLFLRNVKALRKVIDTSVQTKMNESPIDTKWDSYERNKWGERIGSPSFYGDIVRAKKQHSVQMEIEKDEFYSAVEREYKLNAEEQFLLHDVNTNATLFVGLKMLRGKDDSPPPSWYSVYDKLLKNVTSLSSHPEFSIKDKLERYNELARYIRRHEKDIDTLSGQSEIAQNYYANALNIAHLWPMLHASGNMVDAIYKQNFEQIDKWYRALATMRIPMERIARALGNEKITSQSITYPQGDVDGIQGMTLFNLIQEIKRTRFQKCIIEKNGSQFNFRVTAGEVPLREQLFKPSEVVKGKTLPGDGIYAVHQYHSVLAGINIHYQDNVDHVGKPPYIYTFSLDDARATERVNPPLNELQTNAGYQTFSENYTYAKQLKTQARDIDWYNFTFHDVLTPLGKYSVYTVGTKDGLNPIADALHRFNNENDLDKKVLCLEELVSLPLPDMKDWPPEYIASVNKKINILKKLFPMFKPSLQFLLHPTADTYKNLRNVRIQSADILSSFNFSVDQIATMPQRELNGFEGIVLFNLLKNAETHSPNKQGSVDGQSTYEKDLKDIVVTLTDSEISVTNHSDDPHPGNDVLFQYKGRGKSGHTGFGMFTAAKLYAPLIGAKTEAEWNEHEADDHTKYRVRFSLKKIKDDT